MKGRIFCFALLFCLLCAALALPNATADTGKILVVNEKHLEVKAFDQGDYVSLYALCLALGEASAKVTANEAVTISVTKSDLCATATEGQHYIVANGRYRYCDSPNLYQNKVLYVPLSSALWAIGATITEEQGAYCFLETNEAAAVAAKKYAEDEVLWLSRIIHAESGNQPLAGKIAVGTVVMNRVDSPEYPNTIYSVIFDRQYGVQFTPAENGTVWCNPSEESVLAAKCVLEGYRTDPDILFFMNEEIAVSTWISDNCDYAFTIADHSFWS